MNTSLKRHRVETQLLKATEKSERLGRVWVKAINNTEPTIKAQKAVLLWHGRRLLRAKQAKLHLQSDLSIIEFDARRAK